MPGAIRPFANAQEFFPHANRWLRRRGEVAYVRVNEFNDHFVKLDGIAIPYNVLKEQYVFAESGAAVGTNDTIKELGGEPCVQR